MERSPKEPGIATWDRHLGSSNSFGMKIGSRPGSPPGIAEFIRHEDWKSPEIAT
ncbi:MAG: hypothetical protein IT203_05065 [Fimbriimonadaceae bacterium]|nr:hypothetical protein [Fimbriimonadaceae bacterium]